MSTPITAAFAAIQARAYAQVTSMPLYWQDETNQLPDDAQQPFVFFELVTDPGRFIEIGGGRGANRFRTRGELNAFVFVPQGWGLSEGLSRAEPVASAFRSWRESGVSCEGATVHPIGVGQSLVPSGLDSVAGNYACVLVSVPLHFDQVA